MAMRSNEMESEVIRAKPKGVKLEFRDVGDHVAAHAYFHREDRRVHVGCGVASGKAEAADLVLDELERKPDFALFVAAMTDPNRGRKQSRGRAATTKPVRKPPVPPPPPGPDPRPAAEVGYRVVEVEPTPEPTPPVLPVEGRVLFEWTPTRTRILGVAYVMHAGERVNLSGGTFTGEEAGRRELLASIAGRGDFAAYVEAMYRARHQSFARRS